MMKESNLNKIDNVSALYTFKYSESFVFYCFITMAVLIVLSVLYGVSKDRVDSSLKRTSYEKRMRLKLSFDLPELGIKRK
ncbi:MAG: hypothetical protein GY861_28130 [bacterium]|nr:hypothetical protein [bacterium]